MDKDKIIGDFYGLQKAKKQSAVYVKLITILCLVIVIAAFIYSYKVTNSAFNKIIVVERSGEYLKINAESSEKLFITLIKTTCAHLTHYANSFDRLTIKENQAKATILCNKNDIQSVFSLYNQEKSYHEVLERGVIYSCELEDVKHIGDTKPYKVQFTSILSIQDGAKIVKFRIYSEGELIPVTPQYPENVTGFYFTSYKQSIKELE